MKTSTILAVGRFLMLVVLLGLVLILSSCVTATADRVVAFGGKGAYKGRDFALVFDAEKSFRDGAIAAAAAAAGYFSAVTQGAAEVTAQAASKNAAETAQKEAAEAAAVEITKSNNAVKMAELAVPVQ
jgi:hypothetical protein